MVSIAKFDPVAVNYNTRQTSSRSGASSTLVEGISQQPSSSVSLTSTENIKELKQTYDVTNISNKDRGALARKLADSGLISQFEAANLSIVVFPPGSEYNPDAKSNLVAEVQNQLAFSKQGGSLAQTNSLAHVLDILHALQ